MNTDKHRCSTVGNTIRLICVHLCLSVVPFPLVGCGGGGGVSKEFKPQAQEVQKFDNKDWAMVLKTVVTPDGFVKHDMIKNNQGGVRDALFRYVGLIGEVSPENKPELFATDKDKLAYYINAYNALCMYAVYKRDYPPNLAKTVPPYAVYFFDKFPVGGKETNLDTIEKEHVRSVGDPRVHFALNCMSHSCPMLRAEPYEGSKLDEQLNDQGKKYLSDPRGAQKGDNGTVKLSEIFAKFYTAEWIAAYEKKTGKTGATLIDAIKIYAAPDSPVNGATKYEAMTYDWSLNKPS